MLKREMKINLKSFIIWMSIILGLFLLIYLVYPSIINSDNIKMMDEMMKLFPEELLKAFNMDISSMDTAYGYLKTEGFVFILLLTGIYSSIIGSNILLKEENDKTIEYLNTLPITRKSILKDKLICSFTYILLMIIVIGLFNYICLILSGDFNVKEFILLSITPIFSSLPIFAISLYISTFTHKTKKVLGFSLGFVLIEYFLNILSEMNEVIEFLKYFTVYTLSDIRNVIINISINPLMPLISIIITIIFIILIFIRYNKKELV